MRKRMNDEDEDEVRVPVEVEKRGSVCKDGPFAVNASLVSQGSQMSCLVRSPNAVMAPARKQENNSPWARGVWD